jgi:predicted nucleic acid-binding protein
MTGLDTTVLVQLAVADDATPTELSRLLAEEVASNRLLILTPQVICEFLHIVTEARRFANPMDMVTAVNWIQEWLDHPRVQLANPPAAAMAKTLEWIRTFNLGRKRILDTHLAATFQSLGCSRIITSNPDDFAVFGMFHLITPTR